MQSNSVTNGQKFTVSANPVDANGQATAGSSTPLVWTSSDVTVATVSPNGGNQAVVQSVGEGNCNITASGTGPSGTVSTAFSLAVAGGPLAGFVFVFGLAQ